MTPKEKARYLFNLFKKQIDTATPKLNRPTYQSKLLAEIAVREILTNFVGLHKPEYVAFDCIVKPRQFTFSGEYDDRMTGYDMESYWREVIEEIKKL